MHRSQTIPELLSHADPCAVAIRAPKSLDLTYSALRTQIKDTIKALNGWGIGRGDCVAILLPNGATMATAFIATASGAIAAPLNPAYSPDEVEFYLSDLQAKALILPDEGMVPARQIAERLGIAVLTLTALPSTGAGAFVLRSNVTEVESQPVGEHRRVASADTALVLHTSGTTSRPKIVPLTHKNVCASACNIRDTLRLGQGDTGMNIMPLFHIHGLVAGLLAPLSGGGKVFCTPGFNALRFFTWMAEASPTWYTAVPTMHQAILSRASRSQDVILANPLRFIRSSSSSMPPQLIRELEETLRAPLVEAYGMTEAAHQVASNPLPPSVRKSGTVGVAAGPELAVLTSGGDIRSRDANGEVVIRGANVTLGYSDNSTANREAFVDGWFRTGDLGVMDDNGYLSITGRLKEIINRGGEKISPREIDEVILDHPAVAQVVTFALPHPMLGEAVGVAAVLRPGHELAVQDLKAFIGQRVAGFKVPSTIVFLQEIPKGATGKLQRIGLAARLGLA